MTTGEMPYRFSDRPRIEEVASGIYRLDLYMPVAIGPTNAYVFKADGIHDTGRSLLIDAGCNAPETKALFDSALQTLGVSWDEVDVFLTHLHWDHWGGLAQIARPGMTVYSGVDSTAQHRAPVMAAKEIGAIEREVSKRYGITDEYDPVYWAPMARSGPLDMPLTRVREGDMIRVGEYCLEVLETPGHDLCHVCLYDAHAHLLVAGDQMLYNQNPSVMMESEGDQLGCMLESIKRLATLDVSLVLCGHGQEGSDLPQRCADVLDHYERQVSSFKELCASVSTTDPGELAYLTTQNPRRTPWEKRLIFGRRALLAQTMAYLRHLVAKGELPDVYEIVPLR